MDPHKRLGGSGLRRRYLSDFPQTGRYASEKQQVGRRSILISHKLEDMQVKSNKLEEEASTHKLEDMQVKSNKLAEEASREDMTSAHKLEDMQVKSNKLAEEASKIANWKICK
ncbi:unnamed protein product [Trichobilharzia regenti]|nr:unnamed protein product [Trichobilharzia regenti]VDP96767.1 unnamed protein product [Trichobilharzia regenti]VDP96806.1 unnamed protein product [Trichobilharzia regenti]VDP96982.1 unnamed protein product [Trichobilharzia regenti]VDQ06944.1 unnamed protein product [Trichobilharzia regenti]